MNYDELLTDLNGFIYESEMQNKSGIRFIQALRAVVELHNPDEYCCPVCGPSLDICGVEYSCSTIRAIEKELA